MRIVVIVFLCSCSVFKSSTISEQEMEIKKAKVKSAHITYRERNILERTLTDASEGKNKYALLSDIIFNSTHNRFDKKQPKLTFNISKSEGTTYINQQLRLYNNDNLPSNDRAEALHKVGLLFSHPFYVEKDESRTIYYYTRLKKEFSNYYRIEEIKSYLEKQESDEH